MEAGQEAAAQGRWRLYGDEEPHVVAGGHSHVASMLFALQNGRGPSGLRAAVAYAADLHSGPPGDADYWDLLVRAGTGRTVVVVWNGNQHHAGFLLSPNPPFRIFDPAVPDLGPRAGTLIAQEVLREYWTPSFEELKSLLTRSVQIARVLVLGTPPPKSDAVVRQSLQNELFFVDRARELGVDINDLAITPESVRLVMWKIIQGMLRELADESGATFVPVPPSASDDEGLLLPRFSASDVTHANAEFGALMWSQVAASMASRVSA